MPGGFGIENLTFHNSCYPGRWNGFFEAPWQLLRSIDNDANLLEMKRSAAEGRLTKDE